MKLLCLASGGRGGSDFFQGLLDNHPQILQFPGQLNNDDILQILILEDPYEISNKFVNTYPHFFNSKLNKIERHDRLGLKKNKFYKVSREKFIKNFVYLSNKKKKLTKFDKLKNLHIAYSLLKQKKKYKKKIIFVHTHFVDFTIRFTKFINSKNTDVIYIMRNPLSAINSPVKNWLNFENGKFFLPKNLYFQIDLVFRGLIDLSKNGNFFFIVQLEKLHWENKKVMQDFCRIFKIKYNKCLHKPTYFGFKWWGDKVSNRWISGVNRNFKTDIDNNFFFSRDIKFFEYLAKDVIKYYKYNFLFEREVNFNFNLMPFKCELLVWKNAFKQKRIKHILSIPYFYLKRIFLINKFIIKNKYLPYSIGSK